MGSFLVRQHRQTLRWEPTTPWSDVGRVATGFVQEQTIRVTEVDGDGVMELRRIRLELDQPTRDKETELFLLTDLPPEHADALSVAETYRRRWTLENVFQSLTEALNCEIDTLAYPRAALFGFCVALVAYNILAVVRAALRSEHGRDEVEEKASNYHLVQEVATTYAGMMIAIPPSGVGGLPGDERGGDGGVPAGGGQPGVAGEVSSVEAWPEEAATEADRQDSPITWPPPDCWINEIDKNRTLERVGPGG